MTSFCKKNFKKWARLSLTCCCCSPVVTTLVWKCLKMGFSSVVVTNVDTNYHFWILMFDLLFFSATAQTGISPSTLEAKPPTTNEKWEREREKVCVFVCAWKRKRKRGFFLCVYNIIPSHTILLHMAYSSAFLLHCSLYLRLSVTHTCSLIIWNTYPFCLYRLRAKRDRKYFDISSNIMKNDFKVIFYI